MIGGFPHLSITSAGSRTQLIAGLTFQLCQHSLAAPGRDAQPQPHTASLQPPGLAATCLAPRHTALQEESSPAGSSAAISPSLLTSTERDVTKPASLGEQVRAVPCDLPFSPTPLLFFFRLPLTPMPPQLCCWSSQPTRHAATCCHQGWGQTPRSPPGPGFTHRNHSRAKLQGIPTFIPSARRYMGNLPTSHFPMGMGRVYVGISDLLQITHANTGCFTSMSAETKLGRVKIRAFSCEITSDVTRKSKTPPRSDSFLPALDSSSWWGCQPPSPGNSLPHRTCPDTINERRAPSAQQQHAKIRAGLVDKQAQGLGRHWKRQKDNGDVYLMLLSSCISCCS